MEGKKSERLIHGQGHSEDIASRIFWDNNDFFAEVFNKVVFKRDIIMPEALHDTTEAEKAVLRLDKGTLGMTLFRDLAKRWEPAWEEAGGFLSILALENQTHINYQMPFRTLSLDNVNYARQVTDIEHNRGSDFLKNAEDSLGRPMTEDEYLGRFLKSDRISPVITLVVYTGDNPWDGPMSLRDMFKDSPLRDFANDYPMHLLDVKHMSEEELATFSEPLQSCLGLMRLSGTREIKGYIREKENILNNLPRDIWSNLLDMIDARVFFTPVDNRDKKGGNNVCKGLQMYVDEEKMINTMRVDKFHGYSKETVVSDMLHFFKDLDEKAAKEFVEKYWDSEEVNR